MTRPPGHEPTLTWHADDDTDCRVWAGTATGTGASRPGDRLAQRFELLEELGAGGMGVVFRAFDLELEETVAVKLLHTEVHAYGSALGALRREVRAARAIVSPHVVRVFELHHDSDTTFLVMEYIDGSSLAARLATSGRMTLTAALRLLDHVARGLAATHARGLVHRDVKPGNILLRGDDTAVLADFGLSRGPTTGATGQFVPVGTPAYMPPEQALGGALTPSADVFAFGVLAYELLAGALPWSGPNPMALALSKARTPPPPLTTMSPQVPAAVWDVIRRCLAFDPNERLHDGAALLDAVRGAVGNAVPPKARRRSAANEVADLPLLWIRPIEVDTEDAALCDVGDDLRDDLQSELGTRRSIRVVEGGSLARVVREGGCARSAAEAQGITWAVRCRLKRRQDQVRARIQVTRVRTDELIYSDELRLGEFGVGQAARMIADHVARALSASEREPAPAATPEAAEPDPTAAAVALARRHLRTFDPALVDVAATLLAHALAHAPNEPSLLALRACALARCWSLRGAISTKNASELRSLMTQLEGVDTTDGEVRFAHALALLHTGDAVGAARRARLAIARQPSLAGAHAMLARLLAEADFLDEAEHRLEIASRLDPELLDGELTGAILAGLQGRSVESKLAIEGLGRRAEARDAAVFWTFRLALWNGDRAALRRLRDSGLDQAGLHDDAQVRRAIVKAVAIALGEAAPGQIVVDLAHRAPLDAMQWFEMETEVLAFVGAVDDAIRSLAAAMGHGSVALAWWRRCPPLEALRTCPAGASIHARLEHRAVRLYAAIRDARDPG